MRSTNITKNALLMLGVSASSVKIKAKRNFNAVAKGLVEEPKSFLSSRRLMIKIRPKKRTRLMFHWGSRLQIKMGIVILPSSIPNELKIKLAEAKITPKIV